MSGPRQIESLLEAEELRAMKEFNEAILNSANDMITVTDIDGTLTYFNPAAEKITRFAKEEVLGRSITMFYRDPALVIGKMADLIAGAPVTPYEAVIIDKAGHDHIFSITKAPLTDEHGRLIGFITTSRDITEKRRREDELNRLKDFNEAILNSVHDLVVVTDINGHILHFNPTAMQTLGYSLDEMKNRHISELYQDPQLCYRKLDLIKATAQANSYEAVILTKMGQTLILDVNKAPLNDHTGQQIGFASVSRDITGKRRREDELARLKDFNEAILNSVHDLVVVTDLEGRILYFNPLAEQTIGFQLDEMKSHHISELYQDPQLCNQKLDFIKGTNQANSYEAIILTKEGQECLLAVNKAPLYDPEGRQIGFAAVSRDITLRRQAEERVGELQDLLSKNSPIQMEGQLLHTHVTEVMITPPPSCGHDESLAAAIEKLIRLNLPGLPVISPVKKVLGLVTLRDLVDKCFLQAVPLTALVSEVMQLDFRTIQPDAFFFDALAVMVKNRTQMIPVTEAGHLRGLLTVDDMVRSRGASVISVLEGIEEQTSIEGLAGYRVEVDRILQSLVVDGALASQVTSIITEFNDWMTRKVITLCDEKLGPAPVPYAWLGLGSEGRKEQTLTTDQDNALVFDDCAEDDPNGRDYFTRLAVEIVQGLAKCGFQLCPGQIMASNPKWAGSLSTWRQRVQTWVDEPTPERTRDCITFLDFRALGGHPELSYNLRRHANEVLTGHPKLLGYMAEDALSKGPPLGLFKGFILEKSGSHKGEVNLKTQGTLVLIDVLRLLAVKSDLHETNTIERLASLTTKGIFTQAESDSIKEAFETLMGLRLRNTILAFREGRNPSNHINPDLLSNWRRQQLREAFLIAEDLQKRIKSEFWWLE